MTTEYDYSELSPGEALLVSTRSGNLYTLKAFYDGMMRISDQRGLLADGRLIGASLTGGPPFTKPGMIIEGCSIILWLKGQGELITSSVMHLREVGGDQIF